MWSKISSSPAPPLIVSRNTFPPEPSGRSSRSSAYPTIFSCVQALSSSQTLYAAVESPKATRQTSSALASAPADLLLKLARMEDSVNCLGLRGVKTQAKYSTSHHPLRFLLY